MIARFFREAGTDRQPDVLINLSNDGWFHGSAELDMHLAIGVFRAVEHRVPLARAVNTGLSALVDGNGEIRAFLPKETEGVLSVTVPLDDRSQLLFTLGRLAWSVLPGRHDRAGSARNRPQTRGKLPVEELTETPEIPTLGCLPERRAWGKFGQVGANGQREPEPLIGRSSHSDGDDLPLEAHASLISKILSSRIADLADPSAVSWRVRLISGTLTVQATSHFSTRGGDVARVVGRPSYSDW